MQRELIFLKLLDLMTGAMFTGDGFAWMIRSVTLYEDGPAAMFEYRWKDRQPPHDAFSCMSLRWSKTHGFELRPETCSLGRETTLSMQALENRLQRAKNALKKAA